MMSDDPLYDEITHLNTLLAYAKNMSLPQSSCFSDPNSLRIRYGMTGMDVDHLYLPDIIETLEAAIHDLFNFHNMLLSGDHLARLLVADESWQKIIGNKDRPFGQDDTFEFI